MHPNFTTLVELLQKRACLQPHDIAIEFDSYIEGATPNRITYSELDQKANSIANKLLQLNANQQRIILLFPAGIDYVAALFGCFYAGAIAVPAYPPNLTRPELTIPRLEAIINDADAKYIFTNRTFANMQTEVTKLSSSFAGRHWLSIEDLINIETDRIDLNISKDHLAFLQYTSGSTGAPKGVMLSHDNLIHNLTAIYLQFSHSPLSKGVIWLPPYHDMGLIGGILQPLFGGFPVKLMSSYSFLEKPFRWLEAISKYGGTTSGGPDFAYQLCVDRVTETQKAILDLSSWDLAFTGSEPVRSNTLKRFAEAFASCGFRKEAFYPCYGLAESSLLVSGGNKFAEPTIISINAEKLKQNDLQLESGTSNQRELVSCGQAALDLQVTIVNPHTSIRCTANEIGEIWVKGDSIAQGYWKKPEETKYFFKATIKDEADSYYLRTGDLGCTLNNELYVTGRLKDLIIIRGRNYYPQDIETTVSETSKHIRQGSVVAFSMDYENQEHLIIVAEMSRRKVNSQILINTIKDIRFAVTAQNNLNPYDIVLVEPREIPRTSSGKLRRRDCKHLFITNKLKVLKNLQANGMITSNGEVNSLDNDPIIIFLIDTIAGILRVPKSEINSNEPLISLGLDSLMTMELRNQIENHYQKECSLLDLLQSDSLKDIAELISNTRIMPLQSDEDKLLIQSTDPKILSYPQQAQWFIEQLNPGIAIHTLSYALKLSGPLNLELLTQSLNNIIIRHSILNTTYQDVNGLPQQTIILNKSISIEMMNINQNDIPRALAEKCRQHFDLEHGPLIRVSVAKLNTINHIILFQAHHSIFDGWSLGIFIKELTVLYNSFITHSNIELPKLDSEYYHFALWQHQQNNQHNYIKQLNYWKSKLKGELPILQLPTDFPRLQPELFNGLVYHFSVDKTLTKSLKLLCKQQKVTMFSLIMTVWQLLLSRYSNQTDIITGTPIANRNQSSWQHLIGCFINTLPIRTIMSTEFTFTDLLHNVFNSLTEAYTNSDVPFDRILEVLNIARSSRGNPLFQTLLVMRKDELANLSLVDLSIERIPLDFVTTQFDLTLILQEQTEQISFSIEYKSDLWKHESIALMSESFLKLLNTIAESPQQKISYLNSLPINLFHKIVNEWNNTTIHFPETATLTHLFSQQVKRNPDAIAIVANDKLLTYSELDSRSTLLAMQLRVMSVQMDDIVGIHLQRSNESITAILAILKAGAAFLILDNAQPFDRLLNMMKNANIRLLVTAKDAKYPLDKKAEKSIYLEYDSLPTILNSINLPSIDPSQLAYVIYTSGSTGTPKGVMISHHAISHRLLGAQLQHPLSTRDAVLHATAYSFDVAVWEIFSALISGARIVLANRGTNYDINEIIEYIIKFNITMAGFTPSVLRTLLQEPDFVKCTELKNIYCGGEAMPNDLPSLFYSHLPNTKLHNFYGPTETTIDSLSHTCASNYYYTSVPVGKPLYNVQAYILDATLHPVPINVAGELYIGGAGLARGYLHKAKETAEHFIPNKFSNKPGERLYKTGDLAKFLPNGEIEFLGRTDRQIKIRGFRIELNEIETVLRNHAEVSDVFIIPAQNILQIDKILAMHYDDANFLKMLDDLDIHSEA